MGRLTGQLRMRETGLPLKDLTVHFYFAEQSAVPADILDEEHWDRLYAAGWKGLDLEKIGSVLSGPDGQFTLEYGSERGSSVMGRPPLRNIWFVVTGANLAQTRGCPGVLQVACDMRINAGAHEAFLIHIAKAQLRERALLGPVPVMRDTRVRPSMLQNAIASVAATRTPPNLGRQKFSEFHEARRAALHKEIEDRGAQPLRAACFSARLTMAPEFGERADDGFVIGPGDNGGLTVASPNGAQTLALRYNGVHRRPTGDSADLNGITLRIDPKTGNFRLSLAEVADDLRLTDNDAGALYDFRWEQDNE